MTWNQPSSSALHRALRLIMVAGSAASGLCLVFALVALAAGHGTRPQQAQTSSHSVYARTVAYVRGTGGTGTRSLTISGTGAWGLLWSYRCPAGQRGTFRLTETGPPGASAGDAQGSVDTTGQSGQGTLRIARQTETDIVHVRSDCPWSVRAVASGTVAHPAIGTAASGGTRTRSPSASPRAVSHPRPSPPVPSPGKSRGPGSHRHHHWPRRPGSSPSPGRRSGSPGPHAG